MPNRDLIVIGASAGGIAAMREISAALPADLNAAVLVVLHTSSVSEGLLPYLLCRRGRLPATHPDDGESIQKGRVYVARPDFHMIVEDGRIRNIQGPAEKRNRPAINPTFRSAALAYGNRLIAVILTGLLDDGTSGLMAVHAQGGIAVVQDPVTALYPSMPRSALERVPDAHVATLAEIPGLLVRLVGEQIRAKDASPVQ